MAVKVYTTETCPECRVVKSYLHAMNINFEEILVNTQELIEEVISLTGQRRIPVIKTDTEVIIGFDREKIKALVV
ncbi:glutaredoxin family protein [Candidatus Woesearchaeota archaeon]|nr:glutaredoxin family protein [Candidatus Woesearchaeota archaeon]